MFAIDEDARQFLKTGPTGLERYLPYWLASRLEWFIFVILPLLVLAYPLARSLPSLFDNYIRTQIFRWYAEIRKVEQQLPSYSIEQIDEKIEWLDNLHEYLNKRLRIPIFFLSDYYQLRGTLSVAIQRLEKRRQVLEQQQEIARISAPGGDEPESTEYGSAGASSISLSSSSVQTGAPKHSSNDAAMPKTGAADEPHTISSSIPAEGHPE